MTASIRRAKPHEAALLLDFFSSHGISAVPASLSSDREFALEYLTEDLNDPDVRWLVIDHDPNAVPGEDDGLGDPLLTPHPPSTYGAALRVSRYAAAPVPAAEVTRFLACSASYDDVCDLHDYMAEWALRRDLHLVVNPINAHSTSDEELEFLSGVGWLISEEPGVFPAWATGDEDDLRLYAVNAPTPDHWMAIYPVHPEVIMWEVRAVSPAPGMNDLFETAILTSFCIGVIEHPIHYLDCDRGFVLQIARRAGLDEEVGAALDRAIEAVAD